MLRVKLTIRRVVTIKSGSEKNIFRKKRNDADKKRQVQKLANKIGKITTKTCLRLTRRSFSPSSVKKVVQSPLAIIPLSTAFHLLSKKKHFIIVKDIHNFYVLYPIFSIMKN